MLFQLQGIHMAILNIRIQSILLQEILQLLKIQIREFLSMIQFGAKNSEAVKFLAKDKFRVKGEKSDRGSNFPEGSKFDRGSNFLRVQSEGTFQKSLPRSPNAQLLHNIEISSLFAFSFMLAYS
jgi:hypothetical protein